jgi:patatin-like phospholipase/acyl hydrolase
MGGVCIGSSFQLLFLTSNRARATSAAPTYFRSFYHKSTKQTYVDGAIYCNNPAEIAHIESNLIFSDVKHRLPDILLSIGTGLNGKETTEYAEARNPTKRCSN